MLFKMQLKKWTRRVLRESGIFANEGEIEAWWPDDLNAKWVPLVKGKGLGVFDGACLAAVTVALERAEAGEISGDELHNVVTGAYGLIPKYGSFSTFGALRGLDSRIVAAQGPASQEDRAVSGPDPLLRRLFERLAEPLPAGLDGGVESMRAWAARKAEAEQELVDLCLGDSALAEVLAVRRISREELAHLYGTLSAGGAGCWAGDQWVAASALLAAPTLEYSIETLGPDALRRDPNTSISKLVEYFESGRSGPV